MSFDASMLVIDPRKVSTEVKSPVVAWDGAPRAGTEVWEGKIEKRATTPQVVLRRMLDNGGTAVIRLNIGNSAINAKGKEINTGIIMSSNKSVNLDWNEYYALRAAVDEGVERLVEEHGNIYEEVARKAKEKAEAKAAKKTAPAEATAQEEVVESPGDDESPV